MGNQSSGNVVLAAAARVDGGAVPAAHAAPRRGAPGAGQAGAGPHSQALECAVNKHEREAAWASWADCPWDPPKQEAPRQEAPHEDNSAQTGGGGRGAPRETDKWPQESQRSPEPARGGRHTRSPARCGGRVWARLSEKLLGASVSWVLPPEPHQVLTVRTGGESPLSDRGEGRAPM